MSIVVQKGKSFSGKYTAPEIATATDWTGTVGIYSTYPGTAIKEVLLSQSADLSTLNFVLSISDILNLPIGPYTLIAHIISAALDVDTYSSSPITITDNVVSNSDFTKLTMTILKLDGTPVGEMKSRLEQYSYTPENVTAYQDTIQSLPDPNNPPKWQATGGLYINTAFSVFTIPTRDFNTSFEANKYLTEFLYMMAGTGGQNPPATSRVINITYANSKYTASGTVTFPVVSHYLNGTIKEFPSAQAANDYIEALLSDPHVDRTNWHSGFSAPTSYGGGYINTTVRVPITTTSQPIQSVRTVSEWEGVEVKVTTIPFAAGSNIIGSTAVSRITDISGYAEIPVVKGSTVRVSCPALGTTFSVDTTGRDIIDLSELF